jgi:hypothetical protein
VFRHIYLDERSIRFKADPTKPDTLKSTLASLSLVTHAMRPPRSNPCALTGAAQASSPVKVSSVAAA